MLGAAWALLAAARNRRPRVDGSLALVKEGNTVDEFVVAGPVAKVTRGALRVVATRRKDGTVEIKGRQDKAKFTAALSDGGTASLPDGAFLRYTEQRTRMIDMVTDGQGLPVAEQQAAASEEPTAPQPSGPTLEQPGEQSAPEPEYAPAEKPE